MGDIHGNLEAFKQCLTRCNFDKSADTLIQLGDVSDRHTRTAEVVEELISIPSLIAIKGNHDSWTCDWLRTGVVTPEWLENGGRETIASYKRDKSRFNLEVHLNFFSRSQLDYYIDSENRLFIHAGYTHLKGPEFESSPSVCYTDRSLWKSSLMAVKSKKRPNLLKAFTEIFLGHTPTLNWFQSQPMKAFNIWNLDTGAGTTGRLTIMDVDTKEYWQSD